jgi:hypothetical protein
MNLKTDPSDERRQITQPRNARKYFLPSGNKRIFRVELTRRTLPRDGRHKSVFYGSL